MLIKNNYLTILIKHKNILSRKPWSLQFTQPGSKELVDFGTVTAEEINLIIVVTTIASNGKSRCPSKSKHFCWRSRFLIKLTISIPSTTCNIEC